MRWGRTHEETTKFLSGRQTIKVDGLSVYIKWAGNSCDIHVEGKPYRYVAIFSPLGTEEIGMELGRPHRRVLVIGRTNGPGAFCQYIYSNGKRRKTKAVLIAEYPNARVALIASAIISKF